jgi:hypothetical protein
MFKNHVIFTPRVMTKQCKNCNAADKDGLCIHDGDVCPVLPDEPLFRKDPLFLEENHLAPSKILDQNIKEHCLYETLKPEYKSQWFSFMSAMVKNCINNN